MTERDELADIEADARREVDAYRRRQPVDPANPGGPWMEVTFGPEPAEAPEGHILLEPPRPPLTPVAESLAWINQVVPSGRRAEQYDFQPLRDSTRVAEQLGASRARAIIWICALQILDLATTYAAIRWAGAEEGNPLTKWLVDTYLIVAAKAGVCLLIIEVARRTTATIRTVAASWFVCGLYALAVILNALHLVGAAS